MHTNPKKSRAFIITFVAVLLLAIAAYFIFKNGDQFFGTKNSTDVSKTFSPLLGTSKPTDITSTNTNGETINADGTPTQTGTGANSTSGTSSGIGSTGEITGESGAGAGSLGNTGSFGGTSGSDTGAGFGAITPQLNPIPTPSGAGTSTPSTSLPTASPATSTASTTISNPNICSNDDPLVFTDSEKTELADLLRQYYLLSPGLKTRDDVALIENDITTNQALVDQAILLTTQCQAQKSDPMYTGPQAVKNNPYYSGSLNSTAAYLPNFSTFEDLFKIW